MDDEKKLEKQVDREISEWAREQGWSLNTYDSKGAYSYAAKAYRANRGIKKGTPDKLGCDYYGHYLAIELKAPGKENSCSIEQREFLEDKIRNNAFGIVTSSISHLSENYEKWYEFRCEGKYAEAQNYLIGLLPNKVLVRGLVMYIKDENPTCD